MWYEFDQNNSGGCFVIEPRIGIGPRVWIEADSVDQANDRAESLGIYFNGCEDGRDCDCCGDRWWPQWGHEGEVRPDINVRYDFSWNDEVYLHPLVGNFLVVTVDNYNEVLAQFGTDQGGA